MADTSVVANSGNNLGANFAVDLIGNEATPYSKLRYGVPGTATDVSPNNPLPVVANANATVTVLGGTIAVSGGNINSNVNGNVAVTGTVTTNGNAVVTGSVSILGGNVNANCNGNAVVTGSVSILGGNVNANSNGNVVVTGGALTVTGGNINANCNGNAVVTNAGTFAVQNNGTGKTLKTVSNNTTANANIIAAVSTKRIKVYALTVVSAGTNADIIQFKSNGNNGNEVWRTFLQGNSNAPMGYAQSVTPPAFIFASSAGENIQLVVNQTDNLHYALAYWDDDIL